MRVKSIVLEDHCDVAILGGDVVHELAVDIQLALGDLLKTCDHAQSGGLAAAGGSDQNDKFLVGDLKIELLNRDNALLGYLKVDLLLFRLVCLFLFLLTLAADERVNLLYVFENYSCHTADSGRRASARIGLAGA